MLSFSNRNDKDFEQSIIDTAQKLHTSPKWLLDKVLLRGISFDEKAFFTALASYTPEEQLDAINSFKRQIEADCPGCIKESSLPAEF